MNSINTNMGAMVALRNMSSINSDLSGVQNRVSTGLKVSSATDDGAAFAVAQGLRGDIKAYESVNSQLSLAKGTTSVALEASTQISDGLNDLQAVLVKLADENVTGDARTQYEEDFEAIAGELSNFVTNASYNGVNLLQTASTDIDVVANIDGSAYTITAQDLQTSIAALATAPASAAAAATALGTGGSLETATTAVNTALNSLAADSKRLDNQISFNNALSDATEAGLGAIVDADLAKESAKLQALQTKQQLAVQTLSMANQAPSSLLGLFR